MLKVVIAIIAIILLTIAIVWLIDKFVPKKIKPILNLVLWVLIIFLGLVVGTILVAMYLPMFSITNMLGN